ncbi:MAG: 50S ribosomal protein L20 [Patescibacteria group bacterium]|jgi:large subunit ribosomal protein L20
MRVKRGTVRHAKHKKIIKAAKGYTGRRKSVFKLAKQAVLKAGKYSYRDRRVKKREFRSLWIVRINAFLSDKGISYSEFIHKLAEKKIDLNRKILADLAKNNPEVMEKLVAEVK